MNKFIISVIVIFKLAAIQIYSQIPTGSLFHFSAEVFNFPLGSNVKLNLWSEKQGRRQASQSNKDFQPVFQTDGINGLPAISFDGIDDHFIAPGVFPQNSDYTMVVVSRPKRYTHHIIGGIRRTLWLDGKSSPKVVHDGDYNRQLVSSIDPNLRPSLIVVQFRKNSQYGAFFVNGKFADSSKLAINSDSTIFFGTHKGSQSFAGLISEIILYPKVLNSIERTQMEDHLIQKYALDEERFKPKWFTQLPHEGQFFPQDSTGFAKVRISGRIPQSSWDSIFLDYSNSPIILITLSRELKYINGFAEFNFVVNIPANLYNKTFWVRLKKGNVDSLILRRSNILCGDVYLVNGQSNAIWGSLPETNRFIKTIGENNALGQLDSVWNLASCYTNSGGPQIGVWAYQLAKKIVDNEKVPVCIINGAVPGSEIAFHLRDNTNLNNINTIYGNLLSRCKLAQLDKSIKGIFWYQGESDYPDQYKEKFNKLYDAWLQDYPSLMKVYVLQSHHGCGTDENYGVKEFQRNFYRDFPKVSVMSTNGLSGHDGCYFSPQGYTELADRLYSLVKREFYGGPYSVNMDAPNILKAYFPDNKRDQVNIIIYPRTSTLQLPKDTLIDNLLFTIKDYFGLDGVYKQAKSISISGDTIKLKLNGSSKASTLNYLTEKFYLNSTKIFQGPYIRNINNIGMFSAYNVEIENSILTSTGEEHEIDFDIYPNITVSNEISIQVPAAGLYSIRITDLNGRTINLDKYFVYLKETIDIPVQISGMYFIEISKGGHKFVCKWIKI